MITMLPRLILTIRHARAMWRVLSHPKNSRKGSWHHLTVYDLYQCAEQEMRELKAAAWQYEHGNGSVRRVEDEAADVSAYVAMLVDKCRSIPRQS